MLGGKVGANTDSRLATTPWRRPDRQPHRQADGGPGGLWPAGDDDLPVQPTDSDQHPAILANNFTYTYGAASQRNPSAVGNVVAESLQIGVVPLRCLFSFVAGCRIIDPIFKYKKTATLWTDVSWISVRFH